MNESDKIKPLIIVKSNIYIIAFFGYNRKVNIYIIVCAYPFQGINISRGYSIYTKKIACAAYFLFTKFVTYLYKIKVVPLF